MLRDLPIPPLLTTDANDLVDELLVPGLRASVRYDRAVGYFRTSAFAVAAQGLSPFVNNGGHMRLLMGAELDPQDQTSDEIPESLIEEIRTGLLSAERVVQEHVALLGALMRENRLEVRVALGNSRMFHAKVGRFVDERGDSLVFHGSSNETASGWRGNLEQVTVHRSWLSIERAHHDALVRSLDGWWGGRLPGMRVVDLPPAIASALREIERVSPPSSNGQSAHLVADPANPVLTLSRLLTELPEADALLSARRTPGFEGARISARLSIQRLLELAWSQIESMA